MNQSIRIAARNVGRQKKRTLLLGGAVAFGFFIITLVDALASGVVSTVKENFSYAFGGHLYLSGTEVSPLGSELSLISDPTAAEAAISALGDRVASVHRRSRGTGTLHFGSRARSRRVEGVDFSDEADFKAKLDISAGSLDDLDKPGALVLPEDGAAKLGAQIGDTLIFKVTTVMGQANVGEFTLAATTASSGSMGITSAYTSKAYLNELLGLGPEDYQTVNLYLKDVGKSGSAAAEAYSVLSRFGPVEERSDGMVGSSNIAMMRRMIGLGGGNRRVPEAERWIGTKYSLTTIEDLMSPILALVSILDMVSLGVFGILLAIIGVGLLNSYRMVMLERTSEIGTLRAMGVQRSGIRAVFLWEGLIIAASGAAAGLAVALAAMGLLSFADFSSFSFGAAFLDDGRLRFDPDGLGILMNFLILCGMSLAAVSLPARAASNLEPAHALRAGY